MIVKPTFAELEDTARAVILCLKQCTDLVDTKIAIIGGTAVRRYVPDRKPTDEPEDVDFMITVPNPESVNRRLLHNYESIFSEIDGCLFYTHSNGKRIKVDFSTNCRLPYIPEAATIVREVDIDCLPYVGPTDLLVLTINLCGQRNEEYSHIDRDTADAVSLAEAVMKEGPIILSPTQRRVIRDELAEVVHWGPKDEEWWRGVLATALSSGNAHR
ncbi:hypothetical protein FQN49_003653 [Arthroderma sp. PD_2]|nr:hypothetical protein FQN49_003653 [Arthroderma sp. PD_2]